MTTGEAHMKMATWKRYLVAGLVVSAACVALPLGVGRDIVYCLIGFSSAAAILVGVRMNRPARPAAWYLFATATATWAVSDGLFGWYEHVALVTPFPSVADVSYLAVYPLFGAGLLLLGRRPDAQHGRDTGLEDIAILIVGMGLLTWVFLIEPTWTAYQDPVVNRVVGVAYPFCDVLLFAILMRLTTLGREHNPAFLLVASSVGSMLVADNGFAIGAFVPTIGDHTHIFDLGWLLSYVLWGTAALHPSMHELTSPPPPRTLRFSTARLAMLAVAALIGPLILGGEMIGHHPLDIGPVVIAAIILVSLALTGVSRVMRLLDNQTRRLSQLADTDYVTGLLNRRYFVDRLGELLDVAHPPVTGLLLVHLERLSELSDTLGQPTADAILYAVGVRLGEMTGADALVARMGNDRFGVLDPSVTSGEDADRAAMNIREALECPLELSDLSVLAEVSVGAIVLPEGGAETEVALLHANVALSVARACSGRTARYGIGMESGDTLAHLVIGELREAIRHREIVVYYQPQVEIRSGRVPSVEALVRWQHPRYGLLGPDTFVPSAEETGLIGPLTLYVLDSALQQCSRWRREGLVLMVAVNLSVRNLLDPGLVDDVRSALQRHGLEASSLELEITESSAMVNPRRSIQVLGALSELGVKLSIDDYGTGHSSLAYLQKLPVGRLKIDHSFVTGMMVDRASAAIVDSTIELARVLHFEVVAEGVEDDEILLRLRDMKCGSAQGFNLGPPVTASLIPVQIARIEERVSTVLGKSRLTPRSSPGVTTAR
jgi:diguanylate cyclase